MPPQPNQNSTTTQPQLNKRGLIKAFQMKEILFFHLNEMVYEQLTKIKESTQTHVINSISCLGVGRIFFKKKQND